ncbi:MAG: site-specific integrase [Firmicutes bacterium]|nr:site-specific integrase [Bacillota bacterium]
MPRARKLPSGNWRTQGHFTHPDGHVERGSFTASTRVESELQERQWRAGLAEAKVSKPSMTVGQAVDKYIELSAPALSPSTVHRYRLMRVHAFPDLMAQDAYALTAETAQRAVNKEGARISKGKPLSAKTVANEWGLIATALKSVCGSAPSVKLPKLQRGRHVELPDPAEVMAAVKDTEIELPVLLALWLSFSMSEVLGLQAADVEGDLISINQVKIYMGSERIEKDTAKVDTRKRTHKLPAYLMRLIKNTEAWKKYAETGENGPLVPFSDYNLRYRLDKCLQAAGVQRVTFHQLRHMNASVMLALNVPDKYAMERGGWKTPHTMKSVYQHTFSKERLQVDEAVNAYFEARLHTNTAHEALQGMKNGDL